MRPNESETWTVGFLLLTMFLTASAIETHRYYSVVQHPRFGTTIWGARAVERSSAPAEPRRSPAAVRARRIAPVRPAQRPELGHRDRDRAKALMLMALLLQGARPSIAPSR
jgi:hypothetical protein